MTKEVHSRNSQFNTKTALSSGALKPKPKLNIRKGSNSSRRSKPNTSRQSKQNTSRQSKPDATKDKTSNTSFTLKKHILQKRLQHPLTSPSQFSKFTLAQSKPPKDSYTKSIKLPSSKFRLKSPPVQKILAPLVKKYCRLKMRNFSPTNRFRRDHRYKPIRGFHERVISPEQSANLNLGATFDNATASTFPNLAKAPKGILKYVDPRRRAMLIKFYLNKSAGHF